ANASARAQAVSATATLGGTKASNYAVTNPVTTTAKINPAPVTVTFTAADKTYDGNNTATVSNCNIATGKVGTDDVTCSVTGGTLASSNASVRAEAVSATATLGGTKATNYAVTNPVTTTAKINPSTPTVTVSDPLPSFDGSAHAASVLVTGVGGLSLTPSPNYSGGCLAAPIHVAETTPTACTASYSFAGDGDHLGSSDSAAIVINKAASTTKVTGGTFTFDGSAHPASALVTGAGSLSLTPSPSYSGGCCAAPIHVAETTPTACTASYSFAGDGDHTGSNDSVTIVITPAASLTTVSGAGSFVFDGSAHAASVLVTGAGSLSLTPSPSY